MTIPKPARRIRKPRKPIARKVIPNVWRRSRQPDGLARHRELVKRADALWRECIHARGGMCQRCGVRPGVQAHHLVSRRYHGTRWIPQCGSLLCSGCHLLVGQDGEENRLLALHLVGPKMWSWLNVAKHGTKTDIAMSIVLLHEYMRGGDKR
jgi:hypothetical protein